MLFQMAKLKVQYTRRSIFFAVKAYIEYSEQRKKCYNEVDWTSNEVFKVVWEKHTYFKWLHLFICSGKNMTSLPIGYRLRYKFAFYSSKA